MYKYTLTSGNINIKTPHVDNFSDIKIDKEQTSDYIKLHEEFPNGLMLDIIQYANKIEYISNKRIIVAEDFSLVFED